MNDFAQLLKEALLGEEPYRPDPDREALEASVRKFDRRMRTVRGLAAFMVCATSAAFLFGLIALLRSGPETATKTLVLYGSLFVWGSVGVGFGKLWFAMMANHLAVMKELKMAQLRTLERR